MKTLGGPQSAAYDVSSDGAVIVGNAASPPCRAGP